MILVGLIAAWWFATDVVGVPGYVLPPPEQVLRALISGLSRAPWDKAGYWYHAGVTVWEAVLGFAIGSALGAIVGLVLSHWPLLGKSWYPYIVGFQSLPKVALAPLMVVWFGFGLEGKVFITAIITFFPVLVNMMAGYQAVEPERIELARSCNASELHLLTKIVIPSCLPFLFAGLGVASVLSILGAVVGEFVGASAGLGMLLMQYNQAMEISPMFAVILLLAVIGFSNELRRHADRAPLLLLGAAIDCDGATMINLNRGDHAMSTRFGRATFALTLAIGMSCWFVTAVPAQAQKKMTLVQMHPNMGIGEEVFLYAVPKRLGYFAAEGLEVDIQNSQTGMISAQALQANSAQIGTTAAAAIMTVRSKMATSSPSSTSSATPALSWWCSRTRRSRSSRHTSRETDLVGHDDHRHPSLASSSMTASTSPTSSGSSAEVGSSNSITLGS